VAAAARLEVRSTPEALEVAKRVLADEQDVAAAASVAIAIALAAGVPGQIAHQWRLFKQSDVTGVVSTNVYARLGTVTGSHRYQYWQTAVKAFEDKPATGTGPGTFEFYWAQHGPIYEFVRNAHSLYLETLAESGVIGLLPLAGLVLALLGLGVVRSLRAPPLARVSLAAATAAFAAFLVSAGYDWIWQLACAPVAALLLGAAIVAYRSPEAASERQTEAAVGPLRRWLPRGLLAATGLAALIAIAIPLAMTSAIRSSQTAVRAGNLNTALSDALTAQQLEPYAATPRLQRALVLEQAHEYGPALAAVAQAAAREPTNWRIWLVRARIAAEGGHPQGAVRDYRHAHALNPLSPATAQ